MNNFNPFLREKFMSELNNFENKVKEVSPRATAWLGYQPSTESVKSSADDMQNQIDYAIYRLEPYMNGSEKQNIITIVNTLKGCSKNFLKWKEEAEEQGLDEKSAFNYVLEKKRTFFADTYKTKSQTGSQ